MPSEQPTPSRAELIAKYDRMADNPLSPYRENAAEFRAIADALRDAERLDWLETNHEYAIGHPTKTYPTWHLFFNDDARDVSAPTLRTAIDAATLADGGTDHAN